MTTFMIFPRLATIDQSEMDRYASLVTPTFDGHKMKPHVAYGKQTVLEGDDTEGVVVLEFPTETAALAWYNSPAYAAVREHRFRGAKYQVTLVEGL